jgi:hypothetical protein
MAKRRRVIFYRRAVVVAPLKDADTGGGGGSRALWFLGGAAIGAGALFAYQKLAPLLKLKFSGALSGSVPAMPAADIPGLAGIAVRQLRRYAFAASQDKSPVVGITHASYALILLDTLEEAVGRETIAKMGYDPGKIRAFITKNQDRHAEALRKCDPYLLEVLAMERADPNGQLPGHVFAGDWGAAPRGA